MGNKYRNMFNISKRYNLRNIINITDFKLNNQLHLYCAYSWEGYTYTSIIDSMYSLYSYALLILLAILQLLIPITFYTRWRARPSSSPGHLPARHAYLCQKYLWNRSFLYYIYILYLHYYDIWNCTQINIILFLQINLNWGYN